MAKKPAKKAPAKKAPAKKKPAAKKAPAKKAPAKKKPAAEKPPVEDELPLEDVLRPHTDADESTPPKKKSAGKKGKYLPGQLQKLAEEMNQIMGLEPQIDPLSEEVEKAIKADIDEVCNDDPFTLESWDALKKLGCKDLPRDTAEPVLGGGGKPPEKKKKPKGPGVIATIEEFLRASKKGITREELAEKLTKRFPERAESALLSTVRTQVPGRMIKERGVKLVEKDGKFSVK